jgi:hypothetical protein
MSINEECRRFLARSKEGFDNPDFKHAQYLVDLLPELNSGNVFIFYLARYLYKCKGFREVPRA